MVKRAKRHHILVTDLLSNSSLLRETQMVSVGGLPVADYTRKFCDLAQVCLVAIATRVA